MLGIRESVTSSFGFQLLSVMSNIVERYVYRQHLASLTPTNMNGSTKASNTVL